MYQCGICNTLYDLSAENWDEIGKVSVERDIVRTVVKCPGCQRKRLVGGELDFDPYTGGNCIMMFGFDYDDSVHKNLPTFEGIKVEE